MNARFEDMFSAAYVVEVADVAPADAFVLRRPDSGSSGEIVLDVISNAGKRWVGVVKAGTPSVRDAVSGVFSTPAATVLCAVARGDGFLVDVESPGRWKDLDTAGPVVAVRPVLDEGLLLLGSPWAITAIGKDGVQWQTGRLAIEAIRLGEIAEGRLVGVADPDDDEPRDFVIDLRTGRHQGGVPFV